MRATRSRVPRWPTTLMWVFVALATLSLAQGIVDVVIPAATGQESFGLLFELTDQFGPLFLIAYVFLHNVGLACLVPGYGFLAARFERRRENRRWIGILLAGAVVISLLVAAQFIFMAPERFDLPVALAIYMGEASAVLVLALAAARELKDFVPTPAYGWSLVSPFRRLRVPLGYSTGVLLLLAGFEAWSVLAA